MSTLDTAAVTGVVGLVSGFLVPALIARIPEPEPEELDPDELDPDDPEDPAAGVEVKELYVDIARTPYLALSTVVATGLSAWLVGWSLGWAWPLLFLVPLVPVAVALAVVDWRTQLLPTRVIAPSYVLTIVLVLVCFAITRDTDDLVRAGLGWLIGGGLFFVLWFVYPRGLGYGDVRLSGVIGIALGYLGWGPLLVGLYGGFLLGGVGGGLLSVLRVVERRSFPFGPFMLVAALLAVLVGEPVWSHLVVGGS